jgi:hypothetical protein
VGGLAALPGHRRLGQHRVDGIGQLSRSGLRPTGCQREGRLHEQVLAGTTARALASISAAASASPSLACTSVSAK